MAPSHSPSPFVRQVNPPQAHASGGLLVCIDDDDLRHACGTAPSSLTENLAASISPRHVGLITRVRFFSPHAPRPETITTVAARYLDALPAVQSCFLSTPALDPEQVVAGVEAFGRLCSRRSIRAHLTLVLDGITPHFDRLVEQTRSHVEGIDLVVDVSRGNLFTAEDILAACRERGLAVRFRFPIVHDSSLSPDEAYHAANFIDSIRLNYERAPLIRQCYGAIRNRIAYGKQPDSGILSDYQGERVHDARGTVMNTAPASMLGDVYPGGWFQIRGEEGRRNGPRKFLGVLGRHLPKSWQHSLKRVMSYSATRASRAALDALLARARSLHITPRADLPRRLLIIGWYGTETLGDKAILAGLATATRGVVDWSIDVSSLEPYITEYTKRQMPEIGLDHVVSIQEACSRLKSGAYGAVMFGGGPLMGSVPECLTMLEIFCIAKECGAKTIVAGCGIGPLGWPAVDPAIGELLRLADAVVLRDSGSRDLARKALGFTGEASVALDPAFLWASRALHAPVERDPNQILLALREWPIYDYGAKMGAAAEPTRRRFEDELRRMVQAILTANPSAKIVPFCMHKNAVGGDDRAFYRRLFADFPDVLRNLDNRHRPPIDDLAVIARSHAMLAMRFHSLVLGLATNTPLLAIDYTLGGKIAGLLKDLDAEALMLSLADFDGRATAARLMAAAPPPSVDARIAEAADTLESVLRRWTNTGGPKEPGNAPCG